MAVDGSGNLYIADRSNHRIRKVDTSGTITTVAGIGDSRYSGDRGPASEARLNSPANVAVDGSGNLYIADTGNHRIRKVDTSGTITTVAGMGESGFSGDGGPATEARLSHPGGRSGGRFGKPYIADTSNNRLRRVDSQGIITTVATGLYAPRGVAVDSSGNLYIFRLGWHRIRRVDTMGTLTTIAGTGESGFSGDGGPATKARLSLPRDVAWTTRGTSTFADRSTTGSGRWIPPDHHHRRGHRAGYRQRGTGPATQAVLSSPSGVAVDGSGNLYIADTYNSRDPAGWIRWGP